jgi:hypothetical protein
MKRSRRVVWAGVLGLAAAPLALASGQLSEAAGIRTSVPFELGRFDLNVAGTVHRLGSRIGLRTPFSLESTLRLPLRASGFWIGAGAEGSGMDSLPMSPVYSYGVWQSYNRIQVSVGVATRRTRLNGYVNRTLRQPLTDTGQNPPQFKEDTVRARTAYWSDVEGRLAWRLSAMTMEAVMGARPGVNSFAPAVWGRLGASYPVTARFSLYGAFGAEPARMSVGLPASSFASVALRIHTWRAPTAPADSVQPLALVVQNTGAGAYRVAYAVPNASSVELSGDFDNWRPVKLSETRTGLWEATLPLKPGTYHVNVRVNGGRWLPPPGLPQADDDFNGAVGVLVVR